MNQADDSTPASRSLFLFVVLSTILSCGLLIPMWLAIWIVVTIVKITNKHKPATIPEHKTIHPSNEFVDDWEYKFYPLESD